MRMISSFINKWPLGMISNNNWEIDNQLKRRVTLKIRGKIVLDYKVDKPTLNSLSLSLKQLLLLSFYLKTQKKINFAVIPFVCMIMSLVVA